MSKKQEYVIDSVTSKDGTVIGYRQMGSGPGVVLLHGGVNSSQHLMKLGKALSDEFTVYIPDRRGRGLSGPFGDNYGLQREVEDIDALLKKIGAHYLFGTSTGALIVLQSAVTLPAIHKIALYEPLVYVNKEEMDKFNAIIQHYDQEISEGELTSAMITSLDLYHVDPEEKSSLLTQIPSLIWKPIFKLVLEADARNVKGDDVSIKDLLPTLKFDVQIVNETEGKIDNFKDVSAEVLLLSGSKTFLFLKHSLEALDKVLPNSNHVELEGLDHDSALTYGKPKIIAQELKRFFR